MNDGGGECVREGVGRMEWSEGREMGWLYNHNQYIIILYKHNQ